MVYTAASLSLALVEILVRLDLEHMPEMVQVPADIPDNVKVKTFNIKDLPRNWKQKPYAPKLREMGDEWLINGATAVLKVPSVVIPEEFNYLFNPNHSDFEKTIIGKHKPFQFDPRLLS